MDGKNLLKLVKDLELIAEFSKSFDYYLHYNTTANTPHYITLHQINSSEEKIKDNNALINRMKNFELTNKEFFQINDVNGNDLNA